jgi:hypothetical protein
MGEGVAPERLCSVVCGHLPYRSVGTRDGRCVWFGDAEERWECVGEGAQPTWLTTLYRGRAKAGSTI